MDMEEFLAREAIGKTLANYTMAGDRLRADEFVAVFTEDGIIETESVPEMDRFRYQGRAAIHAWMNRWRKPAGEPSVHASSFIRHHLSTCQIDLTNVDSAKARTYFTAYTSLGPDHCGYYLDELRRVGDEWLIAHRRIRLDWRRSDSLYQNAVTRTRG